MRFKHWLTAIFSTSLIAASTLTAQAQSPMGMAPGMAYDGYGGVPMPGSGPPASYSPWPETSPYQNSFSQQTFNGGLWSESENNLSRRYHLSIEYLTGRTRTSNSIVGNTDAQNYPQTIQSQIGTQQQGGGGGGGGGGGQQGQQGGILSPFLDSQGNSRVGFPLFGKFDFAKPEHKMNNHGARAIWGYDNADDSGVRLGFLTNQGSFNYNARDALASDHRDTQRDYALFLIESLHKINELNATGNVAAAALLQSNLTQLTAAQPTTVGRFNNINQVLANNIDNLGGLPLDDGSIFEFPDGTKLGGVTVPYDLEFQMKLRSELYGGNAEWIMSPVLNWGWLRVRPTVGVRYFYLKESFRFFGQDSGLAYTSSQQQGGGGGGGGNQTLSPDIKIHATPDHIDSDQDGIVDNAGGESSGGQQQGGGNQQQNRLNFFSFHDHFHYPISSYLNNDADQHLGGGEVGLTYDFGGESLLLTGTTKFGLLANYQRLNLSGDNIAMHTRESNLLLASTDDATPNSFTDSRTTAHVSPMLEQTINAEAPLFQYVPVLRRFGVFEKARFRAGYSILMIGGVADTTGSVLWQGNPAEGLFPTINGKRNTYVTNNYSFGVSWQY